MQEAAELQSFVAEREANSVRQRYLDIEAVAPGRVLIEPRQWISGMAVSSVRAIILICAIGVLVWKFWKWPLPLWMIIAVSGSIVGVLGMLWSLMFWFDYFQRSTMFHRGLSFESLHPTSEGLADRSSLRSVYLNLSLSWPPAVREEVAYRLFREMVDVPADIGYRYGEELTFRLGIPSSEREQLLMWLRMVLRLSPMDRRVLFEQLSRVALR